MVADAIRDGQLDALRTLLASMNQLPGHANPNNALLPFGRFDRLHVARFVILEATTANDITEFGLLPYSWQPTLALVGDCDGDGDDFLAELCVHANSGLQKIFAHCVHFPTPAPNLLRWMRQHSHQPSANYVNWAGRTVVQVREEAALHQRLTTHLHAAVNEIGREDVRALRQHLLSKVEFDKHEGRLTLTPEDSTPVGWGLRNLVSKFAYPFVLLLLSPLLILLAPIYLWRLRTHESNDPEVVVRPAAEHSHALSVQEDHDVSNQFNVFGDIKPGWFRLLTLKSALALLNYTSRHIYRRGYLTRVRTIHFARWVLLDNNRRLYFASNYDGSLESYMDDFINKVSWGLNLVFSNGVGYPDTRWLIKGGAENEHKFKYTLRRHQLPSAVWYKAYPGLTAFDLSRNHRIRQGIDVRQKSDADIRLWLSLI